MPIESVFVVDDDPFIRDFMREALARLGHEPRIFSSGKDALAAVRADGAAAGCDLLFSDMVMPEIDGLELLRRVKASSPETIVVMMTAYGTIESAVEAVKAGANDYLLKPFATDQIEVALLKAEDQRRLLNENDYLRTELNLRDSREAVLSEHPAMRRVYDNVDRVARSKATVLIHGETGTGKEVIAGLIHQRSPRRGQPMVKVNCAALSENLLESELFGHEKGAFTGATDRKLGRFEMAHGGTLLLDEIGEIPVGLQAKLLRVLELEEFERVGGTKTLHLDVRVISTTNRNLHEEIRRGNFREDLFFRLNVVPIHLPPLRERMPDLPVLVEHFLDEFAAENGERKTMGQSGMKLLLDYHWPGNVRELRNMIHRLVVMEPASSIPAESIRRELHTRSLPESPGLPSTTVGTSIDDMERGLILRTLEHTAGNKEAAARILKVSSRTLRNKLARYEAVR
ncbi:MAG TPA: sigma-54 dependent transcriptional regulator [Planctomycetota bacterium]|nr:sigma-54 dependent transcriptional regulator [Planctomycetota bacterium]